MKTIEVERFDLRGNREIVAKTNKQLEELYDKIVTDEEDFILKAKQESEIIVNSSLTAKVKNGDIRLRSLEGGDKK